MSSFNLVLQVGVCGSVEPRVEVEEGVGQQNWQYFSEMAYRL